MKNKRLTFLTVIVTVLMVLSLSIFVACGETPDANDNKPEEKIEPTEGLVIQNSDFKVVGGTEYPKSINNWTSGRTYSSGYYPSDTVSGAINLTKSEYDKNKSKWDADGAIYNKLIADGHGPKDGEVNNILGIYMPVKPTESKYKQGPTAYSYTSPTFTLEKDSYYKVSVDVLTEKIEKNGDLKDTEKDNSREGAYIKISSSTMQEFTQIKTNGVWKTYTFLIETAPANSSSLSIRLSLGDASNLDDKYGLTTGYAFFDNVTVEKMKDTDTKTARETYYNALADQQNYKDNTLQTKAASLNVPNQYYDFTQTNKVGTSNAPDGWSVVTGNSGKEDPAPHTNYSRNGTIDLTKFKDNYTEYGTTLYRSEGNGNVKVVNTSNILSAGNGILFDDIIDTSKGYNSLGSTNNVYMLSQIYMSSVGLRLGSKISIMKNQEYKLSLDVYTYSVFGAGVTLELKSADGPTLKIEGISKTERKEEITDNDNIILPDETNLGGTTGKWVTYDFIIKGNQFKDYAYDLTLWLGTGGTKDNKEIKYTRYSSTSSTGTEDTTYSSKGTFSTGWVFFDNLSFTNVTNNSGETFPAIGADDNKYVLDCSTDTKTKLIVNLGTENLLPSIVENTPQDSEIYTDKNMPDWFKVNELPETTPALTTKDSAFLGTVNIKATAFDSKNIPGLLAPGMPYENVPENAIVMSLASPSTIGIHSNEIEIAANKSYRISMWVKTQFVSSTSGLYVYLMDVTKSRTDEKEKPVQIINFDKINTSAVKDNNGWQELTFMVRGNQTESKFVSIKATLGTGNRFSTSTLTSGSAFISNMSMTEVTYDNFKDTSTGTYLKNKDFFKAPASSSFTNGKFDSYDQSDENLYNGKINETARIPSNFKASDKIEGELKAGIVDLSQEYAGSQFETLFGDADAYTNFKTGHPSDLKDSPSVLVIGYKGGATAKVPFSYESDSFTLTKESFYKISVHVQTQKDAHAKISLVGEALPNGSEAFAAIQVGTWTKYDFYVKTSIFDASLKLNLALEAYDATPEDENDDSVAQGIVAFDTITLQKLEDETKIPGTTTDYEKVVALDNDGFDVKGDFEKGLVSAPNWSGAADTNQSKDDTKAGVIDPTKLTTSDDEEHPGEGQYIDILGNHNIKKSDIESPSASEVEEKFNKFVEETGYNDATDAPLKPFKKDSDFNCKPFTNVDYNKTNTGTVKGDIVNLIIDKKWKEISAATKITLDQLKADGKDDKYLVIDNLKDSAYTYSSPSYTFTAGKYYQISVDVRTFGVEDKAGKGAYIELYLGNAHNASEEHIFKAINTNKTNANGDWATYNFFIEVQEETVTGAKLKLSLGKYTSADDKSTLTSGYAFFDNIKITPFDDHNDYKTAMDGITNADLKHEAKVKTISSGGSSKAPETINPPKEFDLENLAWMIPTIILAILVIVVVIVFAVKKIKRPKKASLSIEAEEVDKTNENIVEKKNRYDDNME